MTKSGKFSLMPSARVLLPLPGKPVIQMTRPPMDKAYHKDRLSVSFPGQLLCCFLAIPAEYSKRDYSQPFHTYFVTAFFTVTVNSFIEPFERQIDLYDTLHLSIELPAAHMFELIED